MRKHFLLLFCILFICCKFVLAKHIKGGWIQYTYVSAGTTAGTSIYKITVYVFKSCTEAGPMPSSLGIYDASTYSNVQTITNTSNGYTLLNSATKTSFDPCLSNPPVICYQIYTYNTTVTLPDNTNGYLIVAQDANRITGIINITNSVNTGISFLGSIPGILNSVDYHVNNSPYFNFTDTAIICYNSKFNYQFSATDADNDRLTYSFGDGINGTQTLSAPPYSSLVYTTGFSGTSPLGGQVQIDSLTGLISGTAPAVTGEYVIAVYVHEWRNGILINSTKKELQITVGNCSLSAASLLPLYLNCDNYTFTFQNESSASNINQYLWDFGVKTSTSDTSSQPIINYTYADTGTYTVKLTVSNTGGCTDSASAPVKVYPGFSPSFTLTGSCYQSPLQFTDNSFVKYGKVNLWSWDLGDTNAANDTFSIANPSYKYSGPGTYMAQMQITSSVGCSGIFTKTVVVNDKPYINLPFTDTLICSIDSLPLKAQSTGTYQWTPNYNILNATTLNPLVFPKDTTVYTLTVTDNGCVDSVKITVNVLQFITVKLGLDSGICKTDSFALRPVSDALSYRWRESVNGNSLNNYFTKYPVGAPLVTTTYYVTANLGYCQDSAHVTIHVSPYPVAKLGNDTAICFGNRIQLNATYTGSFYNWSPVASLLNANTISPIAGPSKTTGYIFTARDTLYCPKSVSDTMVVKVVTPFSINAGNDTATAFNQPVQLKVTGADSSYTYQWLPSSFLNNAGIYDPVAIINASGIDSVTYLVKVITPEGCTATDDVTVHVYKSGPDILVPSAFTPNGDGKNDVARPVLIGISQLDYFNIYNRWGQLIFSTHEKNIGWDGNFNGSQQPSGAYVYTTQGQDYLGKFIFRKGTIVLIR